jgi:uncharacterized protein YbgA (DUF1722 family)
MDLSPDQPERAVVVAKVKLTGPSKVDYHPMTDAQYRDLLCSYSIEQLETYGRFVAALAEFAPSSVRPAYDAVLGEVIAERRKR